VDILHEQKAERHSFYVERGGKRVAEQFLVAGPDGKIVIIDHTEVDESMRGQGMAKQLTEASVKWAREQKVRLVPLCPFAKAVIDKDPSLQDVTRA
jgi:predicted GNAT family acetyltransferase